MKKPSAKSSIEIKHPGALHRYLGLPEGQPISMATLMKLKNHPQPHVREMAQFAINARSFKH